MVVLPRRLQAPRSLILLAAVLLICDNVSAQTVLTGADMGEEIFPVEIGDSMERFVMYDVVYNPDGVIALDELADVIESVTCSGNLVHVVFLPEYSPITTMVGDLWPLNTILTISGAFGCVNESLPLEDQVPEAQYKRIVGVSGDFDDVFLTTMDEDENIVFQDADILLDSRPFSSSMRMLAAVGIPEEHVTLNFENTVSRAASGNLKAMIEKSISFSIGPELEAQAGPHSVTVAGKIGISASVSLSVEITRVHVRKVFYIPVSTTVRFVYSRTTKVKAEASATISYTYEGEKELLSAPLPYVGFGFKSLPIKVGFFVDISAVAKATVELEATLNIEVTQTFSDTFEFRVAANPFDNYFTRIAGNQGDPNENNPSASLNAEISAKVTGFGGLRPELRAEFAGLATVEVGFSAGLELGLEFKLPPFGPEEEEGDFGVTCLECHYGTADFAAKALDFGATLDLIGFDPDEFDFGITVEVPLAHGCLIECPANSEEPSEAPSETPSETPSEMPSESPSETPSEMPSEMPSESPSEMPSESPSESPSETPAETSPGESPSEAPSQSPPQDPSDMPSPSTEPSMGPDDCMCSPHVVPILLPVQGTPGMCEYVDHEVWSCVLMDEEPAGLCAIYTAVVYVPITPPDDTERLPGVSRQSAGLVPCMTVSGDVMVFVEEVRR